MPKKLTTYRHKSIADQILEGRGSKEELDRILQKLIDDGASPKTIKRVTRAIAARFS